MCNVNSYTEAIKIFLTKDPLEMSGTAGGDFVAGENAILINYCNITCRVDCVNGFITCPGEPERVLGKNDKTLILQYLTFSSGAAPRGNWLSFIQLPSGINHHKPFTIEGIEPLAKEFSDDHDRFITRARELGGSEIEMGDRGAIIPVFPKLPLAFCLWAGDDEFPPNANILFDATAPLHLSTASLYVLGIEISRKLTGAAPR